MICTGKLAGKLLQCSRTGRNLRTVINEVTSHDVADVFSACSNLDYYIMSLNDNVTISGGQPQNTIVCRLKTFAKTAERALVRLLNY